MKVKTIKVGQDDLRMVQGAFVRVVTDGQGCTLPECNCSPGSYIMISDGNTILTAGLTEEQAKLIRDGGLDTSC